jgi:hypothetical protein
MDGIGQSVLCGDSDLPRELLKQLRTFFVLPSLAEHDVLELRMASHDSELTGQKGPFKRGLFQPADLVSVGRRRGTRG